MPGFVGDHRVFVLGDGARRGRVTVFHVHVGDGVDRVFTVGHFIDQIAAEITGQELMSTGVRTQ